ncbi:hypothetical protein [Massilia phosphatilytica]
MTGKINVVLTALLVGCALSVVNARYQRNHLINDIEKAVDPAAPARGRCRAQLQARPVHPRQERAHRTDRGAPS